MRGIEHHLYAGGACQRCDLGYGQQHAVALVDLGEQQQAGTRVALQRLPVGVDDAVVVERFGQHDALCRHAAAHVQPAHRADHAVVVGVGVQHGVTGGEPVVAADQDLHRLGGAAGERDLVGVHAQRLGQAGPRLFQQRWERPPPEPRVAGVHRRGSLLVGLQYRACHGTPVPVVEHHHRIVEVVQRAYVRPPGVVGSQLGWRAVADHRQFQPFHHHVSASVLAGCSLPVHRRA